MNDNTMLDYKPYLNGVLYYNHIMLFLEGPLFYEQAENNLFRYNYLMKLLKNIMRKVYV